MGFWQFIKGTGKRYDLKINANIDERRNVFASTQAAVKYFKDLYEILGSWTLSAAAYNMGEKGVDDLYYDYYTKATDSGYVAEVQFPWSGVWAEKPGPLPAKIVGRPGRLFTPNLGRVPVPRAQAIRSNT